jgi:hypothetical protein
VLLARDFPWLASAPITLDRDQLMRHRLLIVATAVCFTALAAPSSAQVSFGVAGGPSAPAGSLSDIVDPGLHGGLVLGLGLPLLPVSVRGDLMAQRLPRSGGGDAFNLLWAAVNGRLDLLPVPLLAAYVTAGAGLYSSTFDVDPVAATSRATDTGLNAGVGAELNLLVGRPFVEIRYHRVLSDPARAFIPITIGIMF